MKKLLCVIAALLCVAFILTAPAFIASGIGKSIYEIKDERRQTRYEGKIELWHVVTFKTPASSGYSLLKSRMRELEKQLPYVYIDVEGMTAADARARLDAGERPDAISYPCGFIDEEGLLGLEHRSFSAFAPKSGVAYPYMADSYVLAVNTDMLFEEELSAPIGELMDKDTFLLACERMDNALTFSGCEGLDSDLVLDEICLEEGGSGFTEQPTLALEDVKLCEGGMSAFAAGQCAMIICPYAEYIKFLESKEADSLSTQCYDISKNTDCVQMISAYESGNVEKDGILRRVCSCLAGKNTQKKVKELGMFPVTPWPLEEIDRINAYQLLLKGHEDG